MYHTDLPLFVKDELPAAIGSDAGQAILRSIYLEYLALLSRTVHELEEAHNNAEFSAIALLAHRIKASSTSTGALRLGALADLIESRARSAPHELPELIKRFKTDARDCMQQIQAHPVFQ